MADNTASVHAAVTLGAAPQTITTGITSPPSPRALTVTGNASGIAGDVTIVGTDYAGAALTKAIALAGAATVRGLDAFAAVTSITFPAQTHAGTDTVCVGWPDGLFTLAEARAFTDSGLQPLSSATSFPDAVITATEPIIRARFERAIRRALLPTLITETLDGNATTILQLSRKNPAREFPRRPLTVSAASIDGTALTATELAAIRAHPDGRLIRTDGQSWSSDTGYQDLAVVVSYYHGWAAVPELINRAALLYAVRILAQGELPIGASDYEESGPARRFPYPSHRLRYTGDDEVDSILDGYEEERVVIA